MEGPKEPENEGVFFIEDRRPGNVSPVKLNCIGNEEKHEIIEKPRDYIYLSSLEDHTGESDMKSIKADNRIEVPSKNDEVNKIESPMLDLLSVVEDRNPVLTGQETQSPRYRINENYLKLQSQKNASPRRNRFANTCWNCGDTKHALRDCPEPRNHAHIAKNRKEFQDSKCNTSLYKRYHVEDSQRYAELVPGIVSQELRHALSLDDKQLPTHIYMMRLIGYPPGWLKEAVVSHSGISMFDGEGKEVAEPGMESGEILEVGALDKYDARKFIQYPGFNVPPPTDTYDDSKFWGCPPTSEQQSLETMIKKLRGRVVGGYRRKKLSQGPITSELDESSQSTGSYDMEYEDTPVVTELPEDNCKFVPPLPDTELPPPPPLDLPDEQAVDADSHSLLSSSIEETSLLELQEQKKLLLAELNDVAPSCSTPDSRIGKIKSSDLGTSILKSISPYAKLPSAEKFSVDICDVINFENLPDSTGKYKRMSGLIHKVRNKLSEINDDL